MPPEIEKLFQRFLDKQCSPEEVELLFNYFRTEEGDADMVNLIETELLQLANKSEFEPTSEFSVAKNREKLLQIIRGRKSRPSIVWLWSAAASIVLIFLVAVFFSKTESPQEEQLISIYGDDVAPGGNKAMITLDDGTHVELDESKAGIVVSDSTTYTDGTVLNINKTQYATLTTPRSGQYSVILSDGTKIWLSASSSLEYPIMFTERERVVNLKGEAYFEVSKNAEKPFIVHTHLQQTMVLGTVFNIKAYNNKEAITLVSGKVSVTGGLNGIKKQLMPEEQAVVSDGNITVHKVDVSEFTGWKDGLISGNMTGLKSIAAEVERWYDVDFIYPPDFKNNEKAYISINRSERLSSVLHALEQTYGVSFRIKGKEVLVR